MGLDSVCRHVLLRDEPFLAGTHPVRVRRAALTPPREGVVGGPSWTATSRFDVVAHLTRSGSLDPLALPELAAPTQTLLKEHFKLAVHREVRTLPIYALVLAPSRGIPGPHLRPADAQCISAAVASERTLRRPTRGGPCPQEGGAGYIQAGVMSMPQLASMLANRVEDSQLAGLIHPTSNAWRLPVGPDERLSRSDRLCGSVPRIVVARIRAQRGRHIIHP
jgi:hypothetical protein